LGGRHVGMEAETDMPEATFLAQVDGFWRASAFPVSHTELIRGKAHVLSGLHELYSLRLGMPEARGLVYYINNSCIVNAYNDYRGLAKKPNCDLVTTWHKDANKTPTFRASVETTTAIKTGDMCYVNYGKHRLLDMKVFDGARDLDREIPSHPEDDDLEGDPFKHDSDSGDNSDMGAPSTQARRADQTQPDADDESEVVEVVEEVMAVEAVEVGKRKRKRSRKGENAGGSEHEEEGEEEEEEEDGEEEEEEEEEEPEEVKTRKEKSKNKRRKSKGKKT
jgi:hypothetical protein